MFKSILKHENELVQLYGKVPKKLLPGIELTADDFHYMKQFTEAFEPIYILTLALQSEQLAMSDVVVHWYRCKRELLKLPKDNEFTELLLDAFDKRTSQIMENPLLATAAYVDPRLNHKDTLSSFFGDLKPICEQRLVHVLKRMMMSRANDEDKEVLEDSHHDTQDDDDLDRFMEIELTQKSSKMPARSSTDIDLLVKVRRLGMFDKMSVKSNVFAFYENLKATKVIDNDLFEVAVTVLSAPATQVSVERAFSALALVLDELRCNLLSTTIEDILVLGLNRELIGLVDFESMSKT